MIVSLIFLFFQLVIAGLFLFLCLTFVTGGPYVPSAKTSVEAMVKLARLGPGVVVYDLGSGDGRLLLRAATQGVQARGIELNPYLVLLSRLRAFLSPSRGLISIRWGNLWSTKLNDADVVFVYLLPWRMDKLAQKLRDELHPGSIVVSNSFIFPGWKILRQDSKHHVYAYKI